ncbi:hypothetical protein ACEPAF_8417 [Sanghuangporus sanghuang]
MDPPSHGLLQDAGSPSATGRFRPYASAKHRVTRGRYITSNDRRGYIPVYEYPLNGQWIMMDIDDGYILWTGIWKALGNAKADIVKMLESQPDLAPQLRRVRGGYLKIQGTWMPYEVALRLARRVAWTIREDLIPLFGPTFPSTCLSPDQPGYGQILGNQPGRRRGRRAAVPLPLSATLPPPQPSDSDASQADKGQQTRHPGPSSLPPLSAVTSEEYHSRLLSPSQIAGPSGTRHEDETPHSGESLNIGQYSFGKIRPQFTFRPAFGHTSSSRVPFSTATSYSTVGLESGHHHHVSLSRMREPATELTIHNSRDRFSPYQSAAHLRHRSGSTLGPAISRPSPVDLPPLTIPSSQPRNAFTEGSSRRAASAFPPGDTGLKASTPAGDSATIPAAQQTGPGEVINLPPIRANSPSYPPSDSSRRPSQSSIEYSLPPISALSNFPPLAISDSSNQRFDSASVLRRLALDDEEVGASRRASFVSIDEGSHRDTGDVDSDMIGAPTQDQLSRRRRSLSEPPLQPDSYRIPQVTGLATPEVGLSASTSTSGYVYTNVISGQMNPGRGEQRYSDEWDRSAAMLVRSYSFRSRYVQSPLQLREDVELEGLTTEGPSGETSLPSRTRTSNALHDVDVTGRPRKRSATDEEENVHRQNTPALSAGPWRPQAHSRTPTPLGYRDDAQTPSVYTRPQPRSPLRYSAYRPMQGSPFDQE